MRSVWNRIGSFQNIMTILICIDLFLLDRIVPVVRKNLLKNLRKQYRNWKHCPVLFVVELKIRPWKNSVHYEGLIYSDAKVKNFCPNQPWVNRNLNSIFLMKLTHFFENWDQFKSSDVLFRKNRSKNKFLGRYFTIDWFF